LSRRVVEFLVDNKQKLFDGCDNKEYILEDQLIGYALKDQWSTFTKKDICFSTPQSITNVLQFTTEGMSLHPINSDIFLDLLNHTPEEQINKLTNDRGLTFWYRKTLLNKLEDYIKDLILNFVNSKKRMGMG